MDVYAEMVIKIISGQEAIIGPIAVEQAESVKGLKLAWPKHEVTIEGDKASVIEDLIEKYAELFGQISIEVSKQSVAALSHKVPVDSLPEILK